MGKATFYYKQSNAPAPNKPNHIISYRFYHSNYTAHQLDLQYDADCKPPAKYFLCCSTVNSGGLQYSYNGQVLLESRKDSNRWAFIGGGLFLNETLLECVKRETFEETGIILSDEDIKFCKLYDDPSIIIAYPDGNVIRSIMALYTTTLKKCQI
ncbi:MAG: NUDIX domain-containing protein [Lachnospiraceae bacterium]|nr:NUDIX domain-containing protein [Lachnospiraceae bacterium]